MTTKFQFTTVGLLSLVLAACHPGPVPANEDTVPDLPVDTNDLPPQCEAPLIECGGECIDPMTNDEHCGFCDNGCGRLEKGPGAAGGCFEGKCAVGWGVCDQNTSPFTCEEVCGQFSGYSCVENGCGEGGTILWTAYWWEDDGGFGGGQGEEDCTQLQAENPVMLQQVGCDVPLPDAFAASGIVEQANYRYQARCCCDNPEE